MRQKYSSFHKRWNGNFSSTFGVVRGKLQTVSSPVEGWRHDSKVNCKRAQKEKMKTYADMKRREKPTELKAGGDVLSKHTCTKEKLMGKWFVYCSQDEKTCNYC